MGEEGGGPYLSLNTVCDGMQGTKGAGDGKMEFQMRMADSDLSKKRIVPPCPLPDISGRLTWVKPVLNWANVSSRT